MVWRKDGSVLQAGLQSYPADSAHERMNHSVIGVVEGIYHSDNPKNKTSRQKANFRGSRIEATVLVINDEGKDAYWRIPNVVIPPKGTSGPDNYHEELPRATSTTIDGSDALGKATDPTLLDGDYCVVGFIGGHIDQPFMISWWPHPRNSRDPATCNAADQNYLEQGQRIVKRFQGTKFSVTSKGSIFVDTTEANAEVVYKEGDTLDRSRRDDGGDVCLDVKSGRQLEVNFNPPVADPENEPDLLQPNPPQGKNKRDDLLSRYFMSKDFINAVAGRVAHIMGNNDGTDKKDTVLLGKSPTDHLLLGEKVQTTFNALVASHNSLVDKFNTHSHIGNSGSPTSPPNESPAVPNPLFNPLLPPSQPANPPFLSTPADPAAQAGAMPNSDLSVVAKTE